MNFLNKFLKRFRLGTRRYTVKQELVRLYTDAPSTAWNGKATPEAILNDSHNRKLFELLHQFKPELLQRWVEVVRATAEKALAETAILRAMLEELKKLEAEAKKAEAAFVSSLDSYGIPELEVKPPALPKKESKLLDAAFSVGLSFMLFLGVSEYLGIDVQSITSEQYPLAALSLTAAISLTAAAKKGIIKWVIATRSYEPKRTHSDDSRYANTIPFWRRLRQGDPAVYLSVLIVLFEMMFAGPGLLGALPPKLAAQLLFQLTAFAASGLAALINANLAWGTALDTIRQQQEFQEAQALQDQKQEAHQQALVDREQNEDYRSLKAIDQAAREKAAEAHARSQILREQIAEQRPIVAGANADAVHEHARWEASVRGWLDENPEKIEQFLQQPQQTTSNGHSAPTNGRTYPINQ